MNEATKSVIRRDQKRKRISDLSSLVTNPTLGYAGYRAGDKVFGHIMDKMLNKVEENGTPLNVNTGYNSLDTPINKDIESLKGSLRSIGGKTTGLIGAAGGTLIARMLNKIISKRLTKKDYSNLSEEDIDAQKELNKQDSRNSMINSLALLGAGGGATLGVKALSGIYKNKLDSMFPASMINVVDKDIAVKTKYKFLNEFLNEKLNKAKNDKIKEEFGKEKRESLENNLDKVKVVGSKIIGGAVGLGAGALSGMIAAKILTRKHTKPSDTLSVDKSEQINTLRDYVANSDLASIAGTLSSGYITDKRRSDKEGVIKGLGSALLNSNTLNIDLNKVKDEVIDEKLWNEDQKVNDGSLKDRILNPISDFGKRFTKNRIVKPVAGIPINKIINPLREKGKEISSNYLNNDNVKKIDNTINHFLPVDDVTMKNLFSTNAANVASKMVGEYLMNRKKT